MEDALRLAIDTQHCIAHNMPLNSTYGSMLFENEDKQHVQSFFIYENLNIKPYEDKLLFTGDLSQMVLNAMPEFALEVVKKCSFQNSMCDIYNQIQDSKKTDIEIQLEEDNYIQEMIEAILQKEKENNYRKPTEEEITKIKGCQLFFKSIGLDTRLNISKEFISLDLNCEEINLNEEQLTFIIESTLEIFTTFCICPIYNEINEEDEKAYGVRMFWAIDLREE